MTFLSTASIRCLAAPLAALAVATASHVQAVLAPVLNTDSPRSAVAALSQAVSAAA
jgi:hypothetical protein